MEEETLLFIYYIFGMQKVCEAKLTSSSGNLIYII